MGGVPTPHVLAEDGEAAAHRAVVAEGDDVGDRRHAGVDDHLVADGDALDVGADRLDHPGDVAAGNVGHRRLGQPLGRPQVEVVEGARHHTDLDLVGGRRRQLDLPPSIGSGRLVEDPGVDQHAAVLTLTWHTQGMSVVRINAISVPEGRGAELEQRFAARAGQVEQMPGFEEFQLLRPTAGETRYFVYTRWESDEAFQNWVSSQAFGQGHAKAESADNKPVSTGAELLGFDVVRARRQDLTSPLHR